MKKRTIAKTGATMLTMAMLLNGTTVFAAAGTNYGATIEGEKTTTFDKYLVMDTQANVPNATFTYTSRTRVRSASFVIAWFVPDSVMI